MTKAEYVTARNKLRHSQDASAVDEAEEGEELQEIVPLGARYKIGTP
jgi:hypothetical protein